MNIDIRQTIHEGFAAVEMESDQLIVKVIPELGAKLVSLCYKPTNKQWLAGSATGLRKVQYGSTFTDADMSGWDECFPTIDACAYPLEGRYAGVLLPDHGEVWSLPWEAKCRGDQLICTVDGRALKYRLKRTLSFTHEAELCLDYEVTNLGEEALAYMWTAHPQFMATSNTRVRLPEDVTSVLCVYGGQHLQEGQVYEWPHTDACGDQSISLDRIGDKERRDARKFYVQGSLSEGWAELVEQHTGEYVHFAWQVEQVPYLGIWIDEGQFHHQSVCALEPSTGYYDRLDAAYKRGKASTVKPGASVSWQLMCRIGEHS